VDSSRGIKVEGGEVAEAVGEDGDGRVSLGARLLSNPSLSGVICTKLRYQGSFSGKMRGKTSRSDLTFHMLHV
jgi:hypothetical protein